MYRLTNLTQNTTTTYKNRDLVYQALERENAKVKHQEAEAVLLVEELDKKNVVVYQEEIYLPFEGIADSLFLKPGMVNNNSFFFYPTTFLLWMEISSKEFLLKQMKN